MGIKGHFSLLCIFFQETNGITKKIVSLKYGSSNRNQEFLYPL